METVRIHVGGISPKLAADVQNFEQRLSKYGEIVESLELRQKPVLDTYFGFLTIKTDEKQLNQLRTAYNGVNFKGSKLQVNVAKPDYKQKWELDQQSLGPGPTKDELKRHYSEPKREYGVFPGQLRKSRPKNLQNATYRMIKRGTKKSIIVRCRKQRLWGVEKKPFEELVAVYENGQWKDANGSTVETVDFKMLEEIDQSEDKDAAMRVLDQMFNGEGVLDNGVKPMTFSDDDEDIPPGLTPHAEDDKSDEEQADEEGYAQGYEEGNEEEVDEQAEPRIDAQGLKSAYDEQEGSLFGFADDDDDIEGSTNFFDVPSLDEIPSTKERQIEQEVPQVRAKRALFFPHFDSTFLLPQTQLSQINASSFALDKSNWEEDFWSKRGEWKRECKRRKRDVARQLRKKNLVKGRATG